MKRVHERAVYKGLLLALLFLTSCPGSEKTPGADTGGDGGSSCVEVEWSDDADGDGFGDAEAPSTLACEAPPGMVASANDCDDADAAVYPGAPELCMDGRPNDCLDVDGIGAAAACDPSGPYQIAAADVKILAGITHDQAGAAVNGVGDTRGDGSDDILISTKGTSEPAVLSTPNFESVTLDDAQATVLSDHIAAPAGDMDLDGYADVIAGEYEERRGAWVLSGPLSGALSLSDYPFLRSTYTYTLDSTYDDISDNAGFSVAGVGDLNGDGWGDLVVGAPIYSGPYGDSEEGNCPLYEYKSPKGYAVGAAYVVLGPVTTDADLADADGLLIGENTEDAAGSDLASVGDVDGDGLDDTYIGAGDQCEAAHGIGAAYVVLGPATGARSLADADMKILGFGEQYMALSGAGDTDGDGLSDLLMGVPWTLEGSRAGAAFLFYGPLMEDREPLSSDARWSGDARGRVGVSVASAGDMDADGFGDILVGAVNYSEEYSDTGMSGVYANLGAAALIYGPVEGAFDYADLETVFVGPSIGDEVGYSLSSAGDADADGLPDLLVGAPYDDDVGGNAGAAYLILGGGVFFDGTYGP